MMTPKPSCLLLLTVQCFTLVVDARSPNQQTVYQWIDDQGRTHYSHQPAKFPAKAKIKKTRIGKVNRADSTPVKSAVKKNSNRPVTKNRSSKKSKPATQKASRNNNHNKKCLRYQHQLQKIQTKLRRGYKEPQGNRLRGLRRKYTALHSQQCR